MNYKFYANGKCTYVGTVEANSKEEALRKIKDNDYDDVELVDDEMNLNVINESDIEED
jgi:hypothetical protein